MHKSNEFITSPMGESYEGKKNPQPSGHVETDGKASTIQGLPTRTMGPDSVREVTYDHNADLPERTGHK